MLNIWLVTLGLGCGCVRDAVDERGPGDDATNAGRRAEPEPGPATDAAIPHVVEPAIAQSG